MMRYANVNGTKTEPASGIKGTCPRCGHPVTAKCGSIKTHHWAHLKGPECDPWWEPMTRWHLDWQNHFPKDWREVILQNDKIGRFHRADVHTPKGITLEFQHSLISLEVINCRNNFYEKLIWVVNGKQFKGKFELTGEIPDPESPLLVDYHFAVDPYGLAKFAHFIRKDEMNPDTFLRLYSLHGSEIKMIAAFPNDTANQYRLFKWKYKHSGWLTCSAPVFLDLGEDVLYWIRKRKQADTTLIYLQVVNKKDFLAKYGDSRVLDQAIP